MARGKSSKAPLKPEIKRPSAPARQFPFDPIICLGLVLAIFAVYAQSGKFDFVSYDDDLYVYNNPHVKAGLTLAGIKWSLTAIVSSNWMPLTLWSHMLDAQLFGLNAGMQHLVNVLFHAVASVLLFLVLRHATGACAASAFVAFVFALHPLHVESVAWIAERKDVLSACFWFLGLYAYTRYAEQPGPRRYLMVVALFCLGLMAKPMLVTFPFALLLFDIWPLRRFQWPGSVWEKLPLVALSAGSSVVTYFVQRSAGAVSGGMPFDVRIVNALNTYLTYIVQMFWPARLAVLYSYPQVSSIGPPAAAFVILAGVTALVIKALPRHPYYAVGWFWYLGTLVPVIGLVQVGIQSHADRYTYIPLIGLAIMLAWGAMDLMQKWTWIKPLAMTAAPAFCMACLLVASAQAAYWRDTLSLFGHALEVTRDNWGILYNLGYYEMNTLKRYSDAADHFQAVLRIKPGYMYAEDDLGLCLMKTDRPAEAVPHFQTLLRVQPDSAQAEFNLAEALSRVPGRDAEAIPHFQAALRLKPDSPEAINDLGACLLNNGRAAEAVPYFESTVRLKPDSPDAHFNLALALMRTGRKNEAISNLESAQRLHPDPRFAQTLERLRTGH